MVTRRIGLPVVLPELDGGDAAELTVEIDAMLVAEQTNDEHL